MTTTALSTRSEAGGGMVGRGGPAAPTCEKATVARAGPPYHFSGRAWRPCRAHFNRRMAESHGGPGRAALPFFR